MRMTVLGLRHLGEARQAVTGIRPVTVVLASPELDERHDSGMPPVTVQLLARPLPRFPVKVASGHP
jgi:hypothetical protein